MPDLSPSLTLLLQLPHLDEEVEALVITTGNYLISLSQQLGCRSVNNLAIVLSIPLFIFWRSCLDNQKVPSVLKQALITPIFKGKSKVDAKNYRPVALNSRFIKIFETVSQKNLVHHFEEANASNVLTMGSGEVGRVSANSPLTIMKC